MNKASSQSITPRSLPHWRRLSSVVAAWLGVSRSQHILQTGESAAIGPSFIFFAGALAALALIWAPDYLPMVDAPNHLADLHILSSAVTSPLRHMYAVVWKPIPDLGLELVYMALRDIMSPETVLRLCISLSFVLILGAVHTIQRAIFGRLSYAAAAAPIFLFGSPWHMGYINFLMGISLALVALAIYVSARRRLTPILIVALGILGAVMLFCHLAGFAGFVLLLTGLHLSEELTARRLPRLLPFARKILPLGIIFAPGAALYLLCEKPLHTYGIVYNFDKFRIFAVAALATGGEIDAAILIGVIILFMAAHRVGAVHIWKTGKASLVLLGVAIIIMPNAINNAIDVDSRMVSLLVLALLAITELRLESNRQRTSAFMALCLLTAVRTASIAAQAHAYGQTVTQFRADAAAVIAPEKNILVSNDTRTRANCRVADTDSETSDLLTHLASFATIDQEAFIPLIFTGKGMQPLRLQPAYADLGTSASVPVPAILLKPADDPALHERMKQVLEKNHLPIYFLGWPAKFDYVVMFDHGCARNPLPAILKPLATDSLFVIYQVMKQPQTLGG